MGLLFLLLSGFFVFIVLRHSWVSQVFTPRMGPLFIIERGQNFTVRVITSVTLFLTDQTIGWERIIDDSQLKGNLYPDTDKLICMYSTVNYSRAWPPVTTDLHYWAWIDECFFLPSYVWMRITTSLKHWNNGKNNFSTDIFFNIEACW